jgi:hypothetical protein
MGKTKGRDKRLVDMSIVPPAEPQYFPPPPDECEPQFSPSPASCSIPNFGST